MPIYPDWSEINSLPFSVLIHTSRHLSCILSAFIALTTSSVFNDILAWNAWHFWLKLFSTVSAWKRFPLTRLSDTKSILQHCSMCVRGGYRDAFPHAVKYLLPVKTEWSKIMALTWVRGRHNGIWPVRDLPASYSRTQVKRQRQYCKGSVCAAPLNERIYTSWNHRLVFVSWKNHILNEIIFLTEPTSG